MNFKKYTFLLIALAMLFVQHVQAMDVTHNPQPHNETIIDFVRNLSDTFEAVLSEGVKASLTKIIKDLALNHPRVSLEDHTASLRNALLNIITNSCNPIAEYQAMIGSNASSDALQKRILDFNVMYKRDEIAHNIVEAKDIDALMALYPLDGFHANILKNLSAAAKNITWQFEHELNSDQIIIPMATPPSNTPVPAAITPPSNNDNDPFRTFISLCEKSGINQNTIQLMQDNKKIDEQWARTYVTLFISAKDENATKLQKLVKEYLKTNPAITHVPTPKTHTPITPQTPPPTPDKPQTVWSMPQKLLLVGGISSVLATTAFVIYHSIFKADSIKKNCTALNALIKKANNGTLTLADYSAKKNQLTLVTQNLDKIIQTHIAAKSYNELATILRKEVAHLQLVKKGNPLKRIAYEIKHDLQRVKNWSAQLIAAKA